MTTPTTLITGASAGLGAEFARQLSGSGVPLALVARRRDKLDALARELGGDVHVFAADLAEPDAAERLLAEVKAAGLRVATLINNAGMGLGGAFAWQDPERLLAMIDLNIRALTALCRAVLPDMLARKSGAILNVASTAAFQPGPNMAVYYASKAYVLSFTEALHQELQGSGIRVTALCPGPTQTEFFDVAEVTGIIPRMAVRAGPVVAAGLRGLARGKAIVVPGVTNKLMAQAHRLMPRGLMRRVMARVKTSE